MQNKEQLLHFFLSGKINLSQYDQKFLSNLQLLIHTNDRVTTNQSALFDKLTAKYKKQLEKNKVTEEQVVSLSWKTNLVESTSEYTGARIDLTDGKLNLRVPYNKQFISYFRDLDNNPFVWQREERMYSAEFSTMAFKILHTLVPEFFNSTSYSPNLFQVLKELEQYKATHWSPTLVKSNGVYYIAAINESLHNAMTDVTLDSSPAAIHQLRKYGIKISPDLINTKTQEISTEFLTRINDTEIEEMIDWLEALDIKIIHWMVRKGKMSSVANIASQFDEVMAQHGIEQKVSTTRTFIKSDPDDDKDIKVIVQPYTPSVSTIKSSSTMYDKLFVIKNSNSIEVK